MRVSERVLTANAQQACRRKQAAIATKVRLAWKDGERNPQSLEQARYIPPRRCEI
jgi:hypothetical protein